jgi:hypothetical protein
MWQLFNEWATNGLLMNEWERESLEMSQPSSPVVGDVMVGNTMTPTAAAKIYVLSTYSLFSLPMHVLDFFARGKTTSSARMLSAISLWGEGE